VQAVVCDRFGIPRGNLPASEFRATAQLNDPGDATFTLRNSTDYANWLAPWGGMIVLINDQGAVLWCGVPTKRRGALGAETQEVTAKEWLHWLARVSPLILDSLTPPFDGYQDYDTKRAGYVVASLMDRIPQSVAGLRRVPLQPPDSTSGAVVTVGDLDDTISRGNVWDMTQTIRDQGIEMWVETTWSVDRFVPRVRVGNPTIGNKIPVPLYVGDNVNDVMIEEDGELMVTRWRVKGSGGDGTEVFAQDTDQFLLDSTKDYQDRWIDANDELQVLSQRAESLCRNTTRAAMWLTDIEGPPGLAIRPGDAVSVQSPKLDGDPRLNRALELYARVESIEFGPDNSKMTLVVPPNDEAPVIPRRSLARVLGDMGRRVSLVSMR